MMESWDSVELHDWTHYSGEMGYRVTRIRRVLAHHIAPNALVVLGLTRSDWYNPDEDGVDYDFEPIGYIYHGGR